MSQIQPPRVWSGERLNRRSLAEFAPSTVPLTLPTVPRTALRFIRRTDPGNGGGRLRPNLVIKRTTRGAAHLVLVIVVAHARGGTDSTPPIMFFSMGDPVWGLVPGSIHITRDVQVETHYYLSDVE